jgi:hypothetical protein
MVTHSSTSRPVQCLCMAERTGCPVFTDLWSYVEMREVLLHISFFQIPPLHIRTNKPQANVTLPNIRLMASYTYTPL